MSPGPKSPLILRLPSPRRPLHLSLDIDSADPVFAPGTGTTASGGLTPRELEYACSDTNHYAVLLNMAMLTMC